MQPGPHAQYPGPGYSPAPGFVPAPRYSPPTFGSVVGTAGTVLSRNAPVLLWLAAIPVLFFFAAIPVLMVADAVFGQEPPATGFFTVVGVWGAVVLGSTLYSYCAIDHATVVAARRGRVGVREAMCVRHFWAGAATVVVCFVITVIGIVLFVVPGVLFGIFALVAPFIALERGVGPFAAISESFRLTRRRLGLVAGVYFAGVLLANLLGVLLVLALPIVGALNAVLYTALVDDDVRERTVTSNGGRESAIPGPHRYGDSVPL